MSPLCGSINPVVHRLRFLEKIASLWSALAMTHDKIHECEISSFQYPLSLRPQWIYKKGNIFLISDIGLERFPERIQTILTTPWDITYCAPESMQTQPEFFKTDEILVESADVWSLGRILGEAIAHTLLGPKGVKKFRAQRAFERASVDLDTSTIANPSFRNLRHASPEPY